MAHKGHPKCVYTSKAACSLAEHEKLGRCTELTQAKEPTACGKWAGSLVMGRGVCDQHAEKLLNDARTIEKRREAQAILENRLDDYIAWTTEHPSVWDARPKS